MDTEEIDPVLVEVLGPPPKARSLPTVTGQSLDHILRSRTHVRVLRVLVAMDRGINLTARAVAGRATASHARVLETLRHLVSVGLVTAYRTPTHSICCLCEDHPLSASLRSLFDRERDASGSG